MIAGLVAAAAAGTAIAAAASGPGPVPPAKPLAQAIHAAVAAPAVTGISAHVTFTNNLIGASNIQGSDPILNGASGRLWLSSNHHQLRLELQSDNGDAQVVVNNGSFWVYDPTSKTVYEGTLPASTQSAKAKDAGTAALPTIAQIQNHLSKAGQDANVSQAIPGDVAGQAAYTIQVSPKHDGGLLGDAQLAWDAATGVPLRIAVYARGNSTPVLELKATDITYGPVAASDLAISPPSGAKVVKVSTPSSVAGGAADRGAKKGHGSKAHTDIAGVAAVARHVPFTLHAPGSLVGLPRRSTTLLDWAGSPAALVAYGQNLGGIAVIEQAAKSATTPSQSPSGDHRGLNLPTVSINGATGQELDTALGTMVHFTRGGVSYTVVGSVPATAADAAARALVP
jgi:outer membrane lipoprotein-sorting protein